jgi:hypothetical protein
VRIDISLQWPRWLCIEITIPRWGLFAPGALPSSFEAAETWDEQ